MNDELAKLIMESAGRMGVNPLDLGTAISYETAGTFDPWKAGPTTKWGQHRGLIQWGEPQAAKYGVTAETPLADQMRAVERYLADAGVKPGAGLLDIYSAINAGSIGRPNASDAAAGGAPGTVADKVAGMADHRANAQRLLGILDQPTAAAPVAAPMAAPPSTMGLPMAGISAPSVEPDGALLELLRGIAKRGQEEAPTAEVDHVPIDYRMPPTLARLRAQLARKV